MNQCYLIVNWTPGNKFQWNFNRNSIIFIQENAFEKCRLPKWRLFYSGGDDLNTSQRWQLLEEYRLALELTKGIHMSPLRANCIMMTSSNGNVFRVTGPLFAEFTGRGEVPAQGPVTRSFDVFFNLRLNNGWVNIREAGHLRHHRAHCDVTVMWRAQCGDLGYSWPSYNAIALY